MTVYELADLYIESMETMQIWSGVKVTTVFEGSFDEAKDNEYSDYEVCSFGIEDGKIVINIYEN